MAALKLNNLKKASFYSFCFKQVSVEGFKYFQDFSVASQEMSEKGRMFIDEVVQSITGNVARKLFPKA